ncbi:haloacid dehalogenase-like hydrolase [Ruminococcus sp. YRD2003]|uniref:HAD family hydrolase n=1 Tax=Ruminococcus sp. YRD2003 TaxID=1452313 RepID=UPI0008B24E32|nr:haloacid dehalogenase-like hydrolase [Ruminococcus flavefaciens]
MVSERRKKENKPVLAICYDFDKTLSPDDMQAQGYIQSVYDGDIPSFWKESNQMAEDNEMDTNLAYMYKMVNEARGRIVLTRKSLQEYGAKVQLFPGVEEWFERIRAYGAEKGVIVEHYIISSGLKEMIEGTSVAKAGTFEKIYASSFMFDDKDVPIWPAQVINYTNKTQFLFRIEKGILDVNDSGVNDYFSPEDLRVPFRNMVYIGDSDTDIPCMKLVNINGGHSIGVYNNDTLDKTKVYKMIHDKRIKYYAPADYTENSKLDSLVKAIIDRTAVNEVLENIYFDCINERDQNDIRRSNDEVKRNRLDLILSLDGSGSFGTTHTLMKEMLLIDNWTEDEIEMLLDIALNNHPVRYLLNDLDVKTFYQKIIRLLPYKNEKAKRVEEHFE